MNQTALLRAVNLGLAWMPFIFLLCVLIVFGALSPRFLTPDNLLGIVIQASWLIVAALGVNFVLLTAGVDLSIGAVMYLAAVCLGLALPHAPLWVWPVAALGVGAAVGAVNAVLVVRVGLPSFIATMALAFIARGIGLYLSDTQMVFAPPVVADAGRAVVLGAPLSVWLAVAMLGACALLLRFMPFGIYVRAIGADPRGAVRAGIPAGAALAAVYVLSGAFAGLAGFISFSQTSAATGAFGVNAEFLAIAAAVLGGTSLFGGRGGLWAPVMGAVLIMTVQNGLVLIDSNPYAYPVVTGGVIFLAALFDTVRVSLVARLERRRIMPQSLSGSAA